MEAVLKFFLGPPSMMIIFFIVYNIKTHPYPPKGREWEGKSVFVITSPDNPGWFGYMS
jgi:hypothetical protein